MSFRNATIDDAPLIYRWREREERQTWWNGKPISYRSHTTWLRARLQNPLIKLRIWEENNQPVGMIRIDSNGEIAFHAINHDVATRMLHASHEYADEYGRRLKALLDEADREKIRALQEAGFTSSPVTYLDYRP